jgi:acylphosphatase|tara:strand:- start:2199 stop:2492 length:294 start_codon:yes stop_codon:yes gene_type:complete
MLKARRYHICGQVQDVGFRIFAQEIALREGLQGFVANCSDGSVEAEVEGEDTSIERFERAIRVGPPGANVESVNVDERPPSGRADGFSITPGNTWKL